MIDFLVRRWFDISITMLTDDGEGDKVNERKLDLEKRFDNIGWGLLFLAFGALALPNGPAEYAAVALVGTAMLALNGVRLLAGVPIRWFSTVLGATGLIAGTLALDGVRVDAFALFFVILGGATIVAAIALPARRSMPA